MTPLRSTPLRSGTYEVTIDETVRTVRVALLTADGGVARYRLQIDEADPIEVDVTRPEAGIWTLLLGDDSFDVGVFDDGEGFGIDVRGIHHDAEVIDPRRKALRTSEADGAGSIRTQMPGRIVRLLVAEGDTVAKGDPVIVVEAMKMENELKAPRDATIQRICVGEGDLVEAKATLIELA